MEINLNPGFFLPASEYFRRHKDVQKRHSGSLSPLLEALRLECVGSNLLANWWHDSPEGLAARLGLGWSGARA